MIHDYGDRALLIDCDSTGDVVTLAAALRHDALPGVVDIVSGARTVLVTVTGPHDLGAVRTRLAGYRIDQPALPPAPGSADLVIDVVYDGPDLAEVGARLTKDQLVRQVIQGGGNMPAYGKNLSPNQVDAVVAYMVSLRPAGVTAARDSSQPGRPPME